MILSSKPTRKRHRASAPLRDALRMGMEGQVRTAATYSDGLDFDFDNDRTDWDTVPQSEPQMDTDGHRSEKLSV